MNTRLLTLALCAAALAACDNGDVLVPPSPDAALLPAQGASGITIMTRNVYLGFDIDAVLAGETPMGDGLAELVATDFPARAAALADEIAATRPHLVGLQEMIDYRSETPGDFLTTFVPDAETPMIPFLYLLMAALQARGLDYHVAVNNATTDVEVPYFLNQTDYMDVRYTDHDVILVRSDVEYANATAGIFEARLTFDLPGGIPAARPLGYAAVEATVNGRDLLFVSTHLETQDHPAIQVAQVQELMAWMAGHELPIVLVGDLNSAANASAPVEQKTDTYGLLIEAGFHDLWLRSHPFDEGLTCCHATDLFGERDFDQRLDLILVKDGAARLAGGIHTMIVGVDPFQATQPMWASDHAGFVATIRLPAGPQL